MSAVRRARALLTSASLGAVWLLATPALATEFLPTTPAAILEELRSFSTVATVLHIGAHPDDENTALITYFARGRGYRTAYLSLTRGDGGQNEIGPEFDEKLGVARTQELLAARRLDGGRQFFTRAIDFGFSKTPEETLRFWDRDQVLGDVVRIIRQFRPDVIVTRFPIPPGSGGHGHHTASGILGVEAFNLAGDPKAYPEQLAQGLSIWQPKRVAWNGFGGRNNAGPTGPTVTTDIAGTDRVTGESFSTIAGRSRAMHITQGFSNFGGRGGSGPNVQTFMILGGASATNDIFDGIDTTWARVPGGAEIGPLTAKIIDSFETNNPSASVPALLTIRTKLRNLPSDAVLADKRAQLDRILQACLGLSVETVADRPEIVPGEVLKLRYTVSLSGTVPVRWLETRGQHLESPAIASENLISTQRRTAEGLFRAPPDLALTQPYWLRREGSSGIFRVDDPQLIGTPENAPAIPIEYVFAVGDQQLVVADEPRYPEQANGKERHRRVDVVPPVSLRFESLVSLFRPGSTRPVVVEIVARRANQTGRLRLDTPDGWRTSPAEQPFQLDEAGSKVSVRFDVSAPPQPTSARLSAIATVNGSSYSNDRIEINYPHLPLLLLQPPAQSRALSLDFAVRARNIGYVSGAGDSTAQALAEMGCAVTSLKGADLTTEKLRGLDAVVLGVRAFNERKDLASTVTNLFEYVEQGGTVVVQYNRPNGLNVPALGPYPLSIQGPAPQLRVTDERAPVTFLIPDHAALISPNRITSQDFDGWVQERGAYFPSSWSKAQYDTLLAMSDPGEEPLTSGLLIAKHGKGYYVYTGLAFFRQLPAGVPGAYRLLANLISLGK